MSATSKLNNIGPCGFGLARVVLCLIAGLLTGIASPSVAHSQIGKLTDLGEGLAYDINASGVIVGEGPTGIIRPAFGDDWWGAARWEKTASGYVKTPTFLPVASNAGNDCLSVDRTFGVNATGQVAGHRHTICFTPSNPPKGAIVWDNGTLIGLPWHIISPDIYANAINDAGVVVGKADILTTSSFFFRPVYWGKGSQGYSAVDLDTGGLAGQGEVTDVNNNLHMVGNIGTRALFWYKTPTGPHLRVALPCFQSSQEGRAYRMNDKDVVVGACGGQAVVWKKSGTTFVVTPTGPVQVPTYAPTALPHLNDINPSTAHDINNLGQIVGSSPHADGSARAVLWEEGPTGYTVTSLFAPPHLPDGRPGEAHARAINDAGQIVGDLTNQHAFVVELRVGVCQADQTIPVPDSQKLTGNRWTVSYAVSQNDGLVVKDVSLGARYMASQISLPYYTLLGDQDEVLHRCELEPNNPDRPCGSRLVGFKSFDDAVEATYVVGNLVGNDGCLKITQRYEFSPEYDPTGDPENACEPTATLPCAKFRPLVTYEFLERPTSVPNLGVNTVQRLHMITSPDQGSVFGNFSLLSRDCDSVTCALLSVGSGIVPYGKTVAKYGPLFASGYSQPKEVEARAIQAGAAGEVDNYHQTYDTHVMTPMPTLPNPLDSPGCKAVTPGCPECVHIHWRWTTLVNGCGAQFGGGLPLIPPGSFQTVDVAVGLFHPGENDPYDYHTLLNNENLLGGTPVFWYSARSHASKDSFFYHRASYSSQTSAH